MQAVNIHATCGLNPVTGYGKLEIGLIRGLESIGVATNPAQPVSDERLALLAEDVRQRWQSSHARVAPLTIVTASPDNAENVDGPVLLYTMSESTRVSSRWVDSINRHCAGVLVPCPGLVDIYQQSGVTVPVWDVGMGVDYYLPTGDLPPSPIQRGPDDHFVFLTYSLGDMRKGAHLAILAFRQAFQGRPDVKLWVKARNVKDTWLEGCQEDGITIIQDDLTEPEWFALLQTADCFVFPSYGEGFGLPPREAVLAGTPAIATQWLGLWDADQWASPLKVRRMLPCQFDDFDEANAQDGQWAEADLDDLTETMRGAVEYPEALRPLMGLYQTYLLRHFTWQRTAERIMEVIHGLNC